jgi:branched-chain amino acid aminotransferase
MTSQSEYGNEGYGYIDGEFVPMSEMRLPVTDLGFQLADMCYDALHIHKGRYFRLDDHLDRFEHAVAERLYNTLGMGRDGFAEILMECASLSGLRESMVNIVATRGVPTSGHKDLRTCQNRLMVWAVPYYSVVSEAENREGCDIVVADTIRIPPEAVDPRIKNYGRLDFVRAMFEAYDREARYAVLLDGDGNVTEGRGWNIFALEGGRLVSPDEGVLEGITRRTVVELAESLNIEARLEKLSADQLRGAEEIFLTSTAGGIVPVKSVDGAEIGEGGPGPVTQRLTEMYWNLHEDDAYSTPVVYRN